MRGSRILLAVACVVGPVAVPTVAVAGTVARAPSSTPVVTGPPHVAAVAPAGASKYVAVPPQRLADTRPSLAFGYSNVSSNVIRVKVLGRSVAIPSDATAAVLNVTIAGSSAWGFVTVFPAGGAVPDASNVNADGPGRVVANLVHVKLGADGSADIYRSTTMGLVVDLVGVYVPVTGGGPWSNTGRMVTRAAGALRVLDTRSEAPLGVGQLRSVDVTAAEVPASASAVVVNLTIVEARIGFWSAIPDGQTYGGTSSLNADRDNQTRAGQAIVNLSGTGRFNVYTENGGHLLVDVVGYFTGAAEPVTSPDGLFVASSPLRMFDTRQLRVLAPWSGSTYEFGVGNPGSIQVAAVVTNLTATSPWDRGFVTAYPARLGRPNASNLNISAVPQTIANHAIVRVSTSGVALFTQGGSHLIADVAGWYLGPPSSTTQAPPANPVYTPNPASSVYIPKIGVHVAIKAGGGSLDYIANQGYAATWSDINKVATPGNLMLFGHRTTGSAPFRHINNLNIGDTFSILGSDGHWYQYEVMHKGVTTPNYAKIQALAAPFGPVTAQLVACSKLDGSATSTSYRLVVTGRLVSVT